MKVNRFSIEYGREILNDSNKIVKETLNFIKGKL